MQTPIPSAGPYYIKVAWQDELLALERNPNYHGPRPHPLERIVYDLGSSTRRTRTARSTPAGADYAADLREQSAFAAAARSTAGVIGHGAAGAST